METSDFNIIPGWIWHPHLCENENGLNNYMNKYMDFVNIFDLPSEYGNVLIYISSDSDYILWINGHLSSFGQYPDYPNYKVCDCIDITHLVSGGKNKIAITSHYVGVDTATYRKGFPGLTFEVFSDDVSIACSVSHTLVRNSLEYMPSIGGFYNLRISPQLNFNCTYDSSVYDGWRDLDYLCGEQWLSPVKCNELFPDLVPKKLYSRPVLKNTLEPQSEAVILSQGIFVNSGEFPKPPSEQMQSAFHSFISPDEICSVSGFRTLPSGDCGFYFSIPQSTSTCKGMGKNSGVFVIVDLGFEDTGCLMIDICAAEGTVADIAYGEHLDDMRVRSFTGGRHFVTRFVCNGKRQTLTDLFHRVGCRYIQMHIYSDSFTIYNLGIFPSHYPVVKKDINIKMDNLLRNRIFNVSLRTLELCMHEHYEDCPWREQALYTMDSRNQMLCGYYCFENADFAKANILLLSLNRRSDGLLELCSPGKVSITIPCFSLMFIVQLCEYVEYNSDFDFGRKMLDPAIEIIDIFLNRIDSFGLIPCFTETSYWNFYEWAPGLDGGDIFREKEIPESYDAPLNAFLSIALMKLSNLCLGLGMNESALNYMNQAEKLNSIIRSSFWDRNKNLFCTFISDGKMMHFCELVQSLMVNCKAASGDIADMVLESLTSNSGRLVPTTLSMSIFKYEALLTQIDKYQNFVLSDIDRIWGEMLFKGATSFWETSLGAGDFNGGGSLCHGWSAIPAYIYLRYGIK